MTYYSDLKMTSWWQNKPFPSNHDRIFLLELLSRQLFLKNNCEDRIVKDRDMIVTWKEFRDMIDFQGSNFRLKLPFRFSLPVLAFTSGFEPRPKVNNRLCVTKSHNSIPKEVWQVQKIHLNSNTLKSYASQQDIKLPSPPTQVQPLWSSEVTSDWWIRIGNGEYE